MFLETLDRRFWKRWINHSGKRQQFHRRRLPHWQLEDSTYFLTWRLRPEQSELSASERETVSSAIRRFDGDRYELFAFVVMNDHVHVLFSPAQDGGVVSIVQNWKSFTSHTIQASRRKRGPLWQEEYFDRVVRDEKEFMQKANYIRSNPFVRWPNIDDYPWMGVSGDASDG